VVLVGAVEAGVAVLVVRVEARVRGTPRRGPWAAPAATGEMLPLPVT
jgi:hypothetical protein